MNLASITILFPPTRNNSRAITRFGFVEDGKVNVDGEVFIRFRLNKPIVIHASLQDPKVLM